jgi:hypothetical protein
MNLLSLINSYFDHVMLQLTFANHELIRLNRFISRITLHLCN